MPEDDVLPTDGVPPRIESLGVPWSDRASDRLVAEERSELATTHWMETRQLAERLALAVDLATVAELRRGSRDAE